MEKIPRQQKTDLLKIVIFGPESTGKTTISKQLAKHYNTVCIPEFSRIYAEEILVKHKNIDCRLEDVIPIAIGQMKLENSFVKKASKLIIYDTNILETKVYSEIYYNTVPRELENIVASSDYDYYFLSYIDTPWVADGIRDKPNQRKEIFEKFEQTLINRSLNYCILRGNEEQRLEKAKNVIDKLKNKNTKKIINPII